MLAGNGCCADGVVYVDGCEHHVAADGDGDDVDVVAVGYDDIGDDGDLLVLKRVVACLCHGDQENSFLCYDADVDFADDGDDYEHLSRALSAHCPSRFC